jgi:hypothetical protein
MHLFSLAMTVYNILKFFDFFFQKEHRIRNLWTFLLRSFYCRDTFEGESQLWRSLKNHQGFSKPEIEK